MSKNAVDVNKRLLILKVKQFVRLLVQFFGSFGNSCSLSWKRRPQVCWSAALELHFYLRKRMLMCFSFQHRKFCSSHSQGSDCGVIQKQDDFRIVVITLSLFISISTALFSTLISTRSSHILESIWAVLLRKAYNWASATHSRNGFRNYVIW